jgi:hemolysin III
LSQVNTEKAHRVPWTKFFIAVIAQLLATVFIFFLIAPNAFKAEMQHPWHMVMWIALMGLPMSMFEYLYHRYLLHSAILPFMGSMHRAHSTHHGLTYVKAPVTPNEPAKLVEVNSEYPVEEPHQEESMMFPFYSLPIFYAIFMILLALPLKLLFPGQPVLIALILAVTLYYSSYEIWHAILHLPFERFWQPVLDARITKRLAKRMYSFHLMHHWRPTANLAIVGFWGIALWDYVFRTHKRPENLPIHAAEVNYYDAKMSKPLWPINAIDRIQGKMYKGSRKIEKTLARVFLGRKEA